MVQEQLTGGKILKCSNREATKSPLLIGLSQPDTLDLSSDAFGAGLYCLYALDFTVGTKIKRQNC